MVTTDPIELIVADALTKAGIPFVHESDGAELDFRLASGVLIECKQFATDRTSAQIAPYPNVIVIQGRAAATAFAAMLQPRVDQLDRSQGSEP